jgi:general secretion pathway protein J
MAVLAAMAWQGMSGVANAKRMSEQRVDQTLRLGTVLAQWEQDLGALHDTTLIPALAFDGASLRLVRRDDEGLRLVVWSLRDGRWLRWAGPVATRAAALQDNWMASQQLLGNEPAQLTMYDGVESWQVYFYRGNAWSNAQSSGDIASVASPVAASAPAVSAPVVAPRTQLPSGVRLVLTLAGGADGRSAGVLTRDILLAPQWP